MRRRTLFSQVLIVNALVTGLLAAGAAIVLSEPNPEVGRVLAVAVIVAVISIVLNLVLLSSRFGPLEALIEDMEKVDLSRPGANLPDSIDGIGETEEVERLELAFLRMMRRLEAERRRTSSAALMAQERERARVARDLHDEVNQSLTALLLRLEAARSSAPPGLAAELEETKALANQAMRELLKLARQLRPTALDDLGLEAAIAGLVEQVGGGEIRASFSVEQSAPTADGAADVTLHQLPEDEQLVLYRVAQEALANVARHSGATRVEVSLRALSPAAWAAGDGKPGKPTPVPGAELIVRDDGRGFAFDDAGDGLGLAGMRERALLVGGNLEIESRTGAGTMLRLTIPPG